MDLFEYLDILNTFIFGGDANISGVNTFIDILMPYCSLLAGVIMIVIVGTKVLTYFMNPSGNLDPYILVKPVLVLAAIALYQPLVDLFLFQPSKIITSITESAALSATGYDNWDMFSRAQERFLTATGQNGTDGGNIYDILQISTALELVHLFIQIIALLVVGYLLLRQLLLKAIYLIIGILVLPLCLIPSNFEILKKWFFGFFSVLLWVPILRIFQTIITLISQAPQQGLAQPLYSFVLQIVMILFILQVPKYANFLVSGAGDNDGNGYLMAAGRELYHNKLRSKK